MNIKNTLKHPLVYQAFQVAGGFFGARLKAIRAYLPLQQGDKIVDIGCGPGFIAGHLPQGVSYCGFDIDGSYIAYANAKFGDRGAFVCGLFDEAAASRHRGADVVMMNGVLHHLSDEEADQTLDVVKQALGPGGRVFTLDGCYADGQPALARMLLKNDRGRYVRTQERYRLLMAKHFDSVEVHVDDSLSWVPYTWIIMIGRS